VQEGNYGRYYFSSNDRKIAMVDDSNAHQGLEYVACPLHCNSQHELEAILMVQTS